MHRYYLKAKIFKEAILLLFAAFIVSGLFADRAVAADIVAPPPELCYDITGQGTEVPVNGIPNSGYFDFDPIGLNPLFEYEACMTDPGTDGMGTFLLKGWVWNSNLGWISMYCGDEDGDGAPYENLGVSCGNFLYGVEVEAIDGVDPGKFHGEAWGDNVGYISFNCDDIGACALADYAVEMETDDDDCIGDVYSTPAPVGTCAVNPNSTVYAWADSVGWFNLSGIHLPWFEITDDPVLVTLYVDPIPNTVVKDVDAPIADGTDEYMMHLEITKLDGTAITPADYSFNFDVNWTEDSVDKDQTDLTSDCITTPAECAVNESLFGFYGADMAKAFTADITSVAPTSGMNQLYDAGIPVFSYEYFVNDPSDPDNDLTVPSNNLTLGNVKVAVIENVSGVCAYGDAWSGCAPENADDPTLIFGSSFQFVPAIEVTVFENTTLTPANTIQGQLFLSNAVSTTRTCRGTCPAGNVYFETGVESPFKIVSDTNGDTFETVDDDNFDTLSSSGSSVIDFVPVCTDIDPDTLDPNCPDVGENPFIYTIVNQGAAKYFSNKLPRVTGALVVNPVASIQGAVYSTGVTNPQTGQTIRSLGDISTNVLRNTIFKNVSTIIAGAIPPNGFDVTLSSTVPAGGFDNNNAGAITELLNDTDGVPQVYYAVGDVTLNNGGDMDWTGNRTVIVVGADVYIDSDIYVDPAAAITPKPKLGIIALKDLVTGEGGNVYIHPDVTDIQANIFADGPVYSYDGVTANNGVGEPVFNNESDRFGLLLNQLYFEGSVASTNTIGGASDTPPILGDGTPVDSFEGQYTAAPSGRSRARLYDLNFLRYYGYVFERDSDGNAVDKNLSGSIEAEPMPAGDLILNPGGNKADSTDPGEENAVYVMFDPPSASLPGFGVSGGVEFKIKPQ